LYLRARKGVPAMSNTSDSRALVVNDERKSQSKPIYPERCFRVEVEG